MPAERYFYPNLFSENDKIDLTTQEFHHLSNVMRARIGSHIEVVNGLGQLGNGEVCSLEKRHATIYIHDVFQDLKPQTPMILAQAIPRMSRLEWILEKGTELGLTETWLFPSLRSEKREFSANQMTRMEVILISAMKQCGRLYLPKIILAEPIKDWPNLSIPGFFGDVSKTAPSLKEVLCQQKTGVGSLICIGPESGFTDEETIQLKNHGLLGVKLHSNILRTDTAAIAALSLLS